MQMRRKMLLYAGLFPFVWPTVAINLFLLTLAWQRLGLPVMSPVDALVYAFPAAFPATLAAAVWVVSLLEKAAEPKSPKTCKKKKDVYVT